MLHFLFAELTNFDGMSELWNTIKNSYSGYADYLWREILFQYDYKPWWQNYFWGLILISLFFLVLEWAAPWRKNQKLLRKDFWLDAFYMFFNFFIFPLAVFIALSNVVGYGMDTLLAQFGMTNLVAIEINSWDTWARLLVFFFVKDFTHWWVHRLLHRVPWLWEFHKVHHSVEQMGFAAHLRYHWMENVVYKSLEYLPLALIGFGVTDFFIVHMFALVVGHFNHSNWKLPLGPLKYVFNNPQMHIWHHARHLPEDRQYGVNFGLTLSIWDYLFGTAYIPSDGRDIPLGFDDLEEFPKGFIGQNTYGFSAKEDPDSK